MTTIDNQHILPLVQILATARTRQELFSQFFEKIKPLIPMDDVGLVVLNKAGTHWKDWAVTDNYHRTDGNINLKESGLDGYQTIDSITAISLRNTGIISREEIIEKHANLAFYDILVHGPIEDYMYTPLIVGEHTIGALWLDAYQKQTYTEACFPLFKNVAALVAIAVANIQANEEILEREQEKVLLLGISEAIATIRDKKELWEVMLDKIKPFLGFKVSVSTIYSDDYSHYRYFLFSELINASVPSEMGNYLGAYLPIKDTSDEWVLQQGDLCQLTMEEKGKLANANPEVIRILKTAGIRHNLYIKLKSGGKVIGVQHFHFESQEMVTEKVVALATSITHLIAVAISNILANEEILKKEQEKTLLLSISQAIAEIDNMVDLLQSIDRLLSPVFNHADAGVSVADQDKTYITDYHALYADVIPASPEAKRLNTTAQERGFVKMPLAGSLLEWSMKQPPMMGKLADLVETDFEAPFLDYELEGGLTDYFCAPFTVSGNTFGLFNLLLKDPRMLLNSRYLPK